MMCRVFGPGPNFPEVLASTNKRLARTNKTAQQPQRLRSSTPGSTTVPGKRKSKTALMIQTVKIRFTEPQIALVMRAHPNCNLDRLAELSFEFDQAGKIIDCTGTIKNGGSIDHDYAGSGLARFESAPGL
jgi:hypothetical protein